MHDINLQLSLPNDCNKSLYSVEAPCAALMIDVLGGRMQNVLWTQSSCKLASSNSEKLKNGNRDDAESTLGISESGPFEYFEAHQNIDPTLRTFAR